MMTHLLLWGNAYAQVIRNGRGDVVSLYPLMANRMKVDRDANGRIYYEYQMSTSDAPTMKPGTVRLKPDEVLHIPGLGFDGLVGYSPIAMAKNSIGMAMTTEEYGASFFKNGANPSGVLSMPGTVKDPEKIRSSWEAGFGGSKRANKVTILLEPFQWVSEKRLFMEIDPPSGAISMNPEKTREPVLGSLELYGSESS